MDFRTGKNWFALLAGWFPRPWASKQSSEPIDVEPRPTPGELLLTPESTPQRFQLDFDTRLIEAFRVVLDPVTPILTYPVGTSLYRGGECATQAPFQIRRANVFLTTHANYAKSYTRFRNMLPFRYEFRAITGIEIRLVVINAMASVVAVASNDLELVKPNASAIWQRDHMIDLARQVVGINVDGIYFRSDENSDEVLLDNRLKILTIEDLAIYPVT